MNRKKWFVLAKIVISILIISFFIFTVDTNKLTDILSNFRWEIGVLIFVLIVFRNFAAAGRFSAMLYDYPSVSFWKLNEHYFIGSLFNVLLPTAVGGDGIRVLLLKEEGVGAKEGLKRIITERALGLFTLVLFSFIGIHFLAIPWEIFFLVYAIFISYFFVLLSLYLEWRVWTWIKLDGVASEFRKLVRNGPAFAKTLLFSLLFQAISIYLVYMVAISFEITISLWAFFAFVPLVSLFTMLPLSFGGLGLREVAFVYLFGEIGVGPGSMLPISAGTYLTLVVSGLIGSYYYLKSNVRELASKEPTESED